MKTRVTVNQDPPHKSVEYHSAMKMEKKNFLSKVLLVRAKSSVKVARTYVKSLISLSRTFFSRSNWPICSRSCSCVLSSSADFKASSYSTIGLVDIGSLGDWKSYLTLSSFYVRNTMQRKEMTTEKTTNVHCINKQNQTTISIFTDSAAV